MIYFRDLMKQRQRRTAILALASAGWALPSFLLTETDSSPSQIAPTEDERPWFRVPWPEMTPYFYRVGDAFPQEVEKDYINHCRLYFSQHSTTALERLHSDIFIDPTTYGSDISMCNVLACPVFSNAGSSSPKSCLRFKDFFNKIHDISFFKQFLDATVGRTEDRFRVLATLFMWGYEATILPDLCDPALQVKVGLKTMTVLIRREGDHCGMVVHSLALIADIDLLKALRKFYVYWPSVNAFLKDFPELAPYKDALRGLMSPDILRLVAKMGLISHKIKRTH